MSESHIEFEVENAKETDEHWEADKQAIEEQEKILQEEALAVLREKLQSSVRREMGWTEDEDEDEDDKIENEISREAYLAALRAEMDEEEDIDLDQEGLMYGVYHPIDEDFKIHIPKGFVEMLNLNDMGASITISLFAK